MTRDFLFGVLFDLTCLGTDAVEKLIFARIIIQIRTPAAPNTVPDKELESMSFFLATVTIAGVTKWL